MTSDHRLHPRSPLFKPGRIRRALAQWAWPLALGLASAAALAAPPRDRLTLLVPDSANLSAWQAKVWIDSAAEEGIRLDILSNSALLAMGSTAAARIAGLVVPDSAHLRASDAVVAAIKQYAYTGGKLMLVYDAGVLTEAGYYPSVGNSRFADMTSVDYAFWNGGLGANTMVGFGQVVGTAARLDNLSLPPGKYLPYVPPPSLLAATSTTAYVPTSRLDPGGTELMGATIAQRGALAIDDGSSSVRSQRKQSLRQMLGLGAEVKGPVRFDKRRSDATRATDMLVFDSVKRSTDAVAAKLDPRTGTAVELGSATLAADATGSELQAISGYAFGPLSYFSYVTTGSFPGTVHLSSPEFGLVAGSRSYGSGQLLFVNMPLGYLKAIGTDGVPLHGYLNHFAREQVGLATMSVQPRGIGGVIYNWHVDDGDDLTTNMKYLLDTTKVLESGPYSIHFTAGPDVITVGDGNGMNLPANPPAQDLVRRIGNFGKYAAGKSSLPVKHALGSHGGWIHDFWGTYASEANVPDLTPLLTQNFAAIEAVTGEKIREYSSPQGNTPRWAVNWLEARGVVGMYLVSDVGAGMVRSWRPTRTDIPVDSARLANKLWTAPVTPFGKYATFEEFEEFGISDTVSGQWLLDLQSFVVNKRTNRQFYNHPPGAQGHLAPVTAMVSRGDTLKKAKQFNWYTISGLADFSQRRVEATWSSTTTAGVTTFSASHPSDLTDMTWLLPRARFGSPSVTSGKGTVSSDATYWVVTANSGNSLKFKASELP